MLGSKRDGFQVWFGQGFDSLCEPVGQECDSVTVVTAAHSHPPSGPDKKDRAPRDARYAELCLGA